jgi:hypothetical protein
MQLLLFDTDTDERPASPPDTPPEAPIKRRVSVPLDPVEAVRVLARRLKTPEAIRTMIAELERILGSEA